MILIISVEDNLVEAFKAMLPFFTPLAYLDTVVEVGTYLHTLANDKPNPSLILIDAEARPQIITECRQICQKYAVHDIPIIAIIAQPTNRQSVLEAGADDYLLLPLVPSEVQMRLATHLNSASRGFNILLKTIHQMSSGASTYTLNQVIKSLAEIFNASSAWLFLLSPNKKDFNMVGSYNLPPLFRQEDAFLDEEFKECLKSFQLDQSNLPQILPCITLRKADPQDTNGLTHHLSISLKSDQRLMGILNLAYPEAFQISQVEKRMLVILGQDIGTLLEMFHLQEEAQVYATQNAFMVLIAQMISRHKNLDTMLSSTLELTMPLFNALSGEVWLLSADEQWLELASFLSTQYVMPQAIGRANDQGLLGWIIEHDQPLHLNQPFQDPRFDSQVDDTENLTKHALLAVPLHYDGKTIGVLAIYGKRHSSFAGQDIFLLEGVAGVVASAIANTRLIHELQDYVDKQQTLMEERERLQQHIFQAERLVTIGRLTASLSHEIKNPMQAIQGALALSMEELNNPQELTMYLNLCSKESERVVQLIDRMVQIYRPQAELPKTLDLSSLLQEVMGIARKELKRQQITLQADLGSGLPPIMAVANQLHLVFLSLILNLGDAIGTTGGGKLQLRFYASSQAVHVELSTDVSDLALADWSNVLASGPSEEKAEFSFGLSMSYDIIMAHGGTIELNQTDHQTVCRIDFPLLPPDSLPLSPQRSA